MARIVPYILFLLGLMVALLGGPTEVQTLMVATRADELTPVQADVTARYTREHPQGPATEVVEFAYVIDGRTYRGDNHLTSIGDTARELDAQIRGVAPEQTIEVYYDPADPAVAVVDRDVEVLWPAGILGGSLICLVVGAQGVLDERRNRVPRKPLVRDWPEYL